MVARSTLSTLVMLLTFTVLGQNYGSGIPLVNTQPSTAAGGCGSSTPAFVQDDIVDVNAVTGAVVFGTNVTSGNTVICSMRLGGAPSPTMSDTRSSTYTIDKQQTQTTDGHILFIFSARLNSGGANTVTLNRNDAGGTIRGTCLEYSGVADANRVDTTASAQANASTASDSGNAGASTCANALLFGAVSGSSNMITATAGNFGTAGTATSRAGATDGIDLRITPGDISVSATGTYKANFTLGQTSNWATAFVVYKAS